MSRLIPRAFKLLVAVLAVSGLAQMPIFKRYYIADLPGLGWLADYWFTHKLHMLAAALFLALVFYLAGRWLRQRYAITAMGWTRIALIALIVITGALRVYKNQPGASMEPFTTMVVDWTHLGLVFALGLAALAARIFGRKVYATVRGQG